MDSVQDRILANWPLLEAETFRVLLATLRNRLFRAYQDGLLITPRHEIQKWVRPNDKPTADDEILGGIKSFRRDPQDACLVRDDGAWLHFTVTVRQDARKKLTLVSYDFEIVFPEGHTPPWVRLDLNPPDHPNADRELRSHIHPGNDDLQLPAPVMTPQEILEYLVRGLRPRDPDKPRT